MGIDAHVVAINYGYDNFKAYYEEMNTHNKLNRIKVPTYYLCSSDDPCVRPDLYPIEEIEKNENLLISITKRGGHWMYFTGSIIPY